MLCSNCLSVPFDRLPSLPESYKPVLARYLDENPLLELGPGFASLRQPYAFPYHNSISSLARSAEFCDLCKLVKGGVDSWFQRIDGHLMKRNHFQAVFARGDFQYPSKQPLWVVSRLNRSKGFLVVADRPGHDGSIYVLTGIGFCIGADSPLASKFTSRPLQTDSSSAECLEVAEGWLKTCMESHEDCADIGADLPSRLLEIGEPGQPSIRLVETEQTQVKYVALSHCWGSRGHFKTECNTIESRKRGIDVDELPRTFGDAVFISRRLGFRYLWIDSLCICQDDKEDWSREAARMTEVYSNASLVIAADHSPDSATGCFHVRKSRRHVDLSLPREGASDVAVEAISLWPGKEVYREAGSHWEKEPLSCRAWALQEHVMAKRILHYLSDQMYFECNQGIIAEDGYRSKRRRFRLEVPGTADSELVSSQCEHTHDEWYQLVQYYGARMLTRPSDRLPAFSGLAKVYQGRIEAEYLAGIWSNAIIEGLAWRSMIDPDKPGTTVDVAPSWSWASYQGTAQIGLPESWRDIAVVEDYNVELASSNPFGEVNSGWIKVTAPLVPVRPAEKPARYRNINSDRVIFLSTFHEEEAHLGLFDGISASDIDEVSKIKLFALVLGQGSGGSYRCIIVTACKGESNMRRLGYWQPPGDRGPYLDLDGKNCQTVTLL